MRTVGNILVAVLLLPPLRLLVNCTPFLIGIWSRPAYRAVMRGLLKVPRALPAALRLRLKSFDKGTDFIQLCLLFEERAPWPKYLEIFGPRNETLRRNLTGIAYLFWINGRFEEARQAAHFRRGLAEEDVRQNPEQAQTGRESWRAMNDQMKRNRAKINQTQHHRPQQAQNADQAQTEAEAEAEPGPVEFVKASLSRSKIFSTSGFGPLRSARILCAILDLCEQDGYAQARRCVAELRATLPQEAYPSSSFMRFMEGLKSNLNPLLPVHKLKFDKKDAARLGISATQFKRICLEAETLP